MPSPRRCPTTASRTRQRQWLVQPAQVQEVRVLVVGTAHRGTCRRVRMRGTAPSSPRASPPPAAAAVAAGGDAWRHLAFGHQVRMRRGQRLSDARGRRGVAASGHADATARPSISTRKAARTLVAVRKRMVSLSILVNNWRYRTLWIERCCRLCSCARAAHGRQAYRYRGSGNCARLSSSDAAGVLGTVEPWGREIIT